jgi:hypothetical protein
MHIVDAEYRRATLPNVPAYGFVPYPADKQELYTDAAKALYEAISTGSLPPRDDLWKKRCNHLARLFGSVSAQGDVAWFVNSEMLGHPSPEIAGKMVGLMNKISWAIRGRNSKGFADAVEAFNSDHGDEMLDSYLDVALRGEKPIDEPAWAYILWSNRQDGILRIGATADDIRTLTSGLNRDINSTTPVSILAAWPVHDPDDAKIMIANSLREYRTAEGLYFIKPGVAKEIVEQGLKSTGNFVLSPFHVDDEPSPQPSSTLRA